MKIYFEEGQAVSEEILEIMTKAAEYCLEMEEIDEERSEISVTFVDKEEIHELNNQYRGVDSPTDVLSFPQFDDFDDLPEEGDICLGDVVICTDKAKEQAEAKKNKTAGKDGETNIKKEEGAATKKNEAAAKPTETSVEQEEGDAA